MANRMMIVENSLTERVRLRVENKVQKLFKLKWSYFLFIILCLNYLVNKRIINLLFIYKKSWF